MKTTLKTNITVKDICEGFVYNELEGKGLFGLSGKLTIQPEYQRNYIYADGKRDVAVIQFYECEGTETEIKEWFKTINIAGIPLNDQELLNAVYSGPFVTLCKEEFSNSRNSKSLCQ